MLKYLQEANNTDYALHGASISPADFIFTDTVAPKKPLQFGINGVYPGIESFAGESPYFFTPANKLGLGGIRRLANGLAAGGHVISIKDREGTVIESATFDIGYINYPVYDGLSAQGTSASTTVILQYGINIFTTVTPTNYAAKLPQPITGRIVKVINNSTVMLVLYPSNVGGQINDLPVDSPAQVPPDGETYYFLCIRNPLPGAWLWTPPAISQYDSGDIICNTTGSNVTVAANAGNIIERGGFYSSSGWGYNGKNKGLILADVDSISFKESAAWFGITKIKVYTNLSSTGANVSYGLTMGNQVTRYTPGTNNIISNGFAGSGNYGSATSGYYGSCDQVISGATLGVGALTTNIGDPGTCWGELTLVGGAGANDSRIGDIFMGVIASLDNWYSGYISFQIQPNRSLTGLKVRFFIEHY